MAATLRLKLSRNSVVRNAESSGSQNRGAGADQSRAADCEDAHWADPTTSNVARAVDLAVSHRLLILVTFRPEFSPPLIERPHVTGLTLHRLAPCDIDFLIKRVAGNRSLPAGILQDIIERTDGIPLFAEEMTKAVLDADGESDARGVRSRTNPVGRFRQLAGFANVALDRLGPAKNVRRWRSERPGFPTVLLAALVRSKENGLPISTAHCGGFVVRRPPPYAATFKHALVQT